MKLPVYIPNLQHRFGWSGRLNTDTVAIPTSEVIGGRAGRFGPLFKNGRDLRRRFHLGAETAILLVSVSKDAFLERYWRWAKEAKTASRIAELGIAAITIPNFSFFSDAPRFHHLYNRGRLDACLNELAEAHVPVIPHVHALTSADIAYCRAWLRRHPEIHHVCREFQTGNSEEAIDELAHLQEDLGRSLHPVIVGGTRFAAKLRESFESFTLIDSTPFMKALHRHRASERDGVLDWEAFPTTTSAQTGAILRHNIDVYTRVQAGESGRQMTMLDSLDEAIRAREAVRANRQLGLPLNGRPIVRLPVIRERHPGVQSPEEHE